MSRVMVLAVALAVVETGCSPRTEEAIVAGFFNASRLRDRTALQKLATTMFDPGADGIITSFSITGVVTVQPTGHAIKEVSISAPVKLPNGQMVHKDLVVTLERRRSESGSATQRWIVTKIKDAAEPSAPPR